MTAPAARGGRKRPAIACPCTGMRPRVHEVVCSLASARLSAPGQLCTLGIMSVHSQNTGTGGTTSD
ncbi:hypothetical protein GCM10010206_44280 [Streptomyces cinerochromogenes]|nr:hypothetical protein GCM10010206_44280 [Streptomyces cinerochromogenes]